jgi:hypothetical protein
MRQQLPATVWWWSLATAAGDSWRGCTSDEKFLGLQWVSLGLTPRSASQEPCWSPSPAADEYPWRRPFYPPLSLSASPLSVTWVAKGGLLMNRIGGHHIPWVLWGGEPGLVETSMVITRKPAQFQASHCSCNDSREMPDRWAHLSSTERDLGKGTWGCSADPRCQRKSAHLPGRLGRTVGEALGRAQWGSGSTQESSPSVVNNSFSFSFSFLFSVFLSFITSIFKF